MGGGEAISQKEIIMKRLLLGSAAVLAVAATVAWAADAAPKSSTFISADDVQKVLQLGAKATDHTIRVVDMGQGYQMSVAVIHRGTTHKPPVAPGAAASQQPACGLASVPAGAKTGPSGMLSHDSTAETYIV